MKKKKTIGIIMIVLLLLISVFAGGTAYMQYQDGKQSEENFEALQDLISTEPVESLPAGEENGPDEEPDAEYLAAMEARAKYQALFDENDDFVGWIAIEGTNINYPVMQTPNNPDFYLKHDFNKEFSNYGVPYIDEGCAVGISNNLTIYGHHMNNGSMFCDLEQYGDKSFFEEHPTIRFDTLSSLGEYQVICAFRFNTNHEDFRYNEYANMNEEEFSEFVDQCMARRLYDTGESAEYGDELITLSTCEYTYQNGRFVVVAKRIMNE